ncbi:MAG: Ig-like domain-containing protein, partial [Pyrinomonadaceae bacterium]
MKAHFKAAVCCTLILSMYIGAMIAPAANIARAAAATETATTTATSPNAEPDVEPATTTMQENPIKPPDGLAFHLSEGAEQPEKHEGSTTTPAETLSEGQSAAVLTRLPPVAADAADQQEFKFRAASLPAPRTGSTIPVKFPQAEAGPAADPTAAGPLSVLRMQPTGDVPLAPQLSVTFSQPMVAVTSQEVAAQTVPVQLSPLPPGKWRWIGTKTILFDPDFAGGRFPMATEFKVTVPAGTRSATGGILGAAKTWSFKTPAPIVQNKYPLNGPTRRDTLMFVSFDQAINPVAVLPTIKVSAGGRPIATRLATEAEISSNPAIKSLAAQAQKGRWLAFRAIDASGNTQDALPSAASISVNIGPRVPSAEGPLTSEKPDGFSFATYGPMKYSSHECGYNKQCSPFDSWRIEFTNPIDGASFSKATYKVEPDVPNLKFSIYNDTIYFEGAKQGRRTYKVTIDGALKDTFGQSLGQPFSVTFNVGPAPTMLSAQGGQFVVLDPSGPPRFSVYSVNQPAVKVSLYAVGPEDWTGYINYLRSENNYYDEKNKQKNPPGRLIYSKNVPVAMKPDEMVETPIDLRPALKDGLGHCVLIVDATVRRDKYDRDRILTWIESTQIGLDAFVDANDLMGWATNLKDGKPLSGVEMSIYPATKISEKAHASRTLLDRIINWDQVEKETDNALTEFISGAQNDRTADNGLVRIPLPTVSTPDKQNLLVARQGRDVAILPEQTEYYGGGYSWFRRAQPDELRWFVFDDRKMYRPGEEVHIKGWMRIVGGGKT